MSIVFRNTLWQVAEKILRMAGGLFMTVLVAQYLGPDGFGLLNYAFAFSTLFQLLTGLGFEGTLVKALIDNPRRAGKIMGLAILMRLLAALLMLALSMLIIRLAEPDRPQLWQMMLLLGLAFVVQAGETIDFQFQASQKIHKTSLIRLFGFLVSVIFRLWLIFTRQDLVWFASVLLMESMANALLFFYFSRGDAIGFPGFSFRFPDSAKNLLKDGLPMVFSSMVWFLYSRLDQIMVARFLGDAQSGYFSVSTRIVEVFIFLPAALASSMLPGLINSYSGSKAAFHRKMQMLNDMVLLFGFLICTFLVCFAPLLVRYSFGKQFLPASEALAIQGFVCIFSFLGSAAQPYFISKGLTSLLFFRNLMGAVLNIVLNFFWIPALGIAGACFATLVSTFAVHVLFNAFQSETRDLLKMQANAVVCFFNGKSWMFLFEFARKYRKSR
jgi:O-antigen/teichoic acid export membrane protein